MGLPSLMSSQSCTIARSCTKCLAPADCRGREARSWVTDSPGADDKVMDHTPCQHRCCICCVSRNSDVAIDYSRKVVGWLSLGSLPSGTRVMDVVAPPRPVLTAWDLSTSGR